MALFSFHCQNYKAGALVGIDGHNRRLHKNHKSNPDIDNERSAICSTEKEFVCGLQSNHKRESNRHRAQGKKRQ